MEKFRSAFIAELDKLNLGTEIANKVLSAFDNASVGFCITESNTDIIPYDQNRELYKTYIAVKSVEGLSKLTLYNYKLDLEKFFQDVPYQLNDIKANTIRLYLNNYQTKHGVQISRVEKIRQTLSGFFSWAFDEGYVESNPMRLVKAIKQPKRKRKSLTREQFDKMRRACVTARERAILDVLFATGCRVSELCSMQRDDFDFVTKKGTVIGKGNKERYVYLNAAAKLSLEAYYRTRDDESPYMFVSSHAPYHGVTRESIGKCIKSIGERAKVPWVSPHIIRHTSATLALQGGMAIQNVQQMLGHEKIETTMIYLDIDSSNVQYEHLRYVV